MVTRIALLAAASVYTAYRVRKSRTPARCGLFSQHEFEQLNCGHYHDAGHAHAVADLVGRLAQSSGCTRERRDFLTKVALLHDADLRWDLDKTQRKIGTPARVPVTISWLLRNRERLLKQMGWNDSQMDHAVALIARTEFPFDHNPRSHGTEFDGMTPVELYETLLRRLPPSERREVMTQALMLRFADQCSYYVEGFPTAVRSLVGLAQEWANQGQAVNIPQLWENTPTFLRKIGSDLTEDQGLQQRLGLEFPLPNSRQLFAALGWRRRRNFMKNVERFQEVLVGSLKAPTP